MVLFKGDEAGEAEVGYQRPLPAGGVWALEQLPRAAGTAPPDTAQDGFGQGSGTGCDCRGCPGQGWELDSGVSVSPFQLSIFYSFYVQITYTTRRRIRSEEGVLIIL